MQQEGPCQQLGHRRPKGVTRGPPGVVRGPCQPQTSADAPVDFDTTGNSANIYTGKPMNLSLSMLPPTVPKTTGGDYLQKGASNGPGGATILPASQAAEDQRHRVRLARHELQRGRELCPRKGGRSGHRCPGLWRMLKGDFECDFGQDWPESDQCPRMRRTFPLVAERDVVSLTLFEE